MRELEINLTIKHVYARKKKELKRSGRNGNVEYGEARKEGDDCCKDSAWGNSLLEEREEAILTGTALC